MKSSSHVSKRSFPMITALSIAMLAITAPTMVNASSNRVEGAVFAMTNAVNGNEVVVFNRMSDGSLDGRKAFATGGTGTGGGLGNQGALALSHSGQWLLAVNPGSNTVSVFLSVGNYLSRTDVEPSGGVRPVSVTIEDNIVYVLNAGSDDVQGFRLSIYGHLTPIAGSKRALSGTGTGPAQIEFNRDGDVLAVTEKATSKVLTFSVDSDGLLGQANVQNSPTPTPFGFAFGRRDQLFVSEAARGAAGGSSLSSYRLNENGTASVTSASVPNGQSGACWVVTTRDGRYAYVSNTGSSTLSTYQIQKNGSVTLANAIAASTGTATGPTDMALDRSNRFLYVLNPRNSTVSAFSIGAGGTLQLIEHEVSGLQGSPSGLVAR